MALRVLLADESTTIKRVIQLALQDFAVEVRSVSVGLDVSTVAKAFKPDILFVDVLLAKKSGYEVARELKTDKDTAHIPLVLMWSGFMELEESKVAESKCDRRLEKPFEAEVLRQLVVDLVPKTSSQPVKDYLDFPKMPEFKEDAPQVPVADLGSTSPESIDLDGDELDMELAQEEFSQVPLHLKSYPKPFTPPTEEAWTHQTLGKGSLSKRIAEISQKATVSSSPEADPDFNKYLIPEGDLGQMKVETSAEFEEISFVSPSQSESAVKKLASSTSKPLTTTESVVLEKLAREEARAIIEEICWKILPEITERVVREEVNRLMKEAEKTL